MGKRVLAFVAAWVVTYILAVSAASQAVLGWLESLGRDITLSQRMSYIGHDLAGMIVPYGVVILVALGIAFLVVALVVRKAPNLRLMGYVLGGFIGITAIHLTLQLVFGMTPVWATVSPFGLLMQGLAGLVGGYVFVRINPRSPGVSA